MNIGIIGAGNIGGNLGRRWSAAGHSVKFGLRDPQSASALVAECGARASAGLVADAASFGDVVVLATPWAAVPAVLEQAGAMAGKVVIDATNPLRWDDGPVHAVDRSGAESIAERIQGTVVKAFNTLGAEHLLDPVVGGVTADLFLASDDAAAKQTTAQLGRELGFNIIDVGPLRNARAIEYIAVAWIHLAMKGGLGRNIAFKVLSSG